MTDHVEYDGFEFWGDLNHLVQPVVGMLRMKLRHPDRELSVEYMEQRLSLLLGLADLALSQGRSIRPIDVDALRDGRADTGTGFFENESDSMKTVIQDRYAKRLSERINGD